MGQILFQLGIGLQVGQALVGAEVPRLDVGRLRLGVCGGGRGVQLRPLAAGGGDGAPSQRQDQQDADGDDGPGRGPPVDIAADASAAPVQTDVEDVAYEAARAAAAQTLQQAQAFIARDGTAQPFARHELARLLDECHATGVLRSDDYGTVLNDRAQVLFQFDPNSDLPDDLARAGSALLVHIVNTARTRHHDDDLNPWPEPAPEGETLHERLRRTGRAVQNLLVVHYDALQPDPASEAAYAEFSTALNALDRHLLAQAMGAGEGEAA